MAWLRSDSKAILAIHTHMVTNNPRMSVSHNGHNSWTLSIDVVQRNDSGLYMCQINTEPMTSQVSFYFLFKVVRFRTVEAFFAKFLTKIALFEFPAKNER